MAEKGRQPTAGERHVMATETRGKKLSEITTDEVRAKQLAKYSEADRRRLAGLVEAAQGRGALPTPDVNHRELIEWAAEHLFERESVVSEKSLLVAAIEENLGTADVMQLRAALRESSAIVQVEAAPEGRAAEQALVTSLENLLREREAIALVEVTAGQFDPLGRSDRLPSSLKEDQRIALERLLASGDGVVALRGPAGAGKTTALQAFDKALREAGHSPVYAAPQHAGRRVLAAEGFGNPRTVTQLLLDVGSGRQSLKNRVLVVDEAGLLSAKAGHELLKTAINAGARVVLVGDEKQMSAVEAGDFLAVLKNHSSMLMPELKEIRRQLDPEYRQAMKLMSQGRVRDGLIKLDDRGMIHEDRGQYLPAAAKAFIEKSRNGVSALLVAPTWAEINKLTGYVRDARRQAGELVGADEQFSVVDNLDLTSAQRRLGRNYRAGQVVTTGSKVGGLTKGIWYEIAEVGQDNTLTLVGGKRLDLKTAGRRLQVADSKRIPVAQGDRLLLQGNDKKLGVSNGMFVTVRKVSQKTMVVEVVGERKLPARGAAEFLPDLHARLRGNGAQEPGGDGGPRHRRGGEAGWKVNVRGELARPPHPGNPRSGPREAPSGGGGHHRVEVRRGRLRRQTATLAGPREAPQAAHAAGRDTKSQGLSGADPAGPRTGARRPAAAIAGRRPRLGARKPGRGPEPLPLGDGAPPCKDQASVVVVVADANFRYPVLGCGLLPGLGMTTETKRKACHTHPLGALASGMRPSDRQRRRVRGRSSNLWA